MTEGMVARRFATVPVQAVEDWRIGAAAFRVLVCISAYCDTQGRCRLSASELAARLSISRQAVQRSVGQLVALGYLCADRPADGVGRYRLFDAAECNASLPREVSP